MYFAIHTLGPSHLWTYVLSAALYTVTTVATFKIAEILFNTDIAALAAVMLTLHYGFTRRAQLYNHNTVLIALMAITVLLILLALRKKNTFYWVGAGFFSGLSVLTKYQALLPLLGIVVALVLSQNWQKNRVQLMIALCFFAIPLLPHALWVVQNDYKTVSYALSYIDNSEFATNNSRAASFFVGQVRYFAPLMIFSLLVWAFSFVRHAEVKPVVAKLTTDQSSWLIGLVIFPLTCIVFFAAALGIRLQTHWGLQTSQFLVIFWAYWVCKRFGKFDATKLWIWAVIQVVVLSIFVAQGIGLIQYARQSLAVRSLPAEKFSTDAFSFWSLNTKCPLRYITGDRTMGAMISAYSGRTIAVLEDGDYEKSPWIHPSDMEKHGYLEVSIADQPATEPNTRSINFSLTSFENPIDTHGRYLVMKFNPPQMACH